VARYEPCSSARVRAGDGVGVGSVDAKFQVPCSSSGASCDGASERPGP
jgi:hypothetical protein